MLRNCVCEIATSSAIALNGNTSLQITIPVKTYNNGQCFGLRLEQAIPSTGTPLPVSYCNGRDRLSAPKALRELCNERPVAQRGCILPACRNQSGAFYCKIPELLGTHCLCCTATHWGLI